AGRTIHTFGLRRKDIVDYLDDEVCTAAAPDFPGWTQAVAAWKDAQMPKPFKTWVSATYGLRLDRRSVRSLAAATKAANRVPKEFLRLTREIVAAANA
ncbi:MAG TPA: hypothetical protein PK902_11675, partial [Actinomycetota bacterium]|nr:hypothetical protein [Actinomycetota bacterium]